MDKKQQVLNPEQLNEIKTIFKYYLDDLKSSTPRFEADQVALEIQGKLADFEHFDLADDFKTLKEYYVFTETHEKTPKSDVQTILSFITRVLDTEIKRASGG